MTRFYSAVLAVAVTLGVAACGGSNKDAAADASRSSSVPFDRAFIDAMVPHHAAAIEMARDAKASGLSQPELLEVARNIIATQRSEISQLRRWREEWYGPGPLEPEDDALAALGLSAEEAGMTHGQHVTSANNVDHTFARMMIAHHRGAIRMARRAQEHAGHQEILDLADAVIAAQELEIDTMKPYAGGEHH